MSININNAAVLGIGISNRPLIEYLLNKGAALSARDFKPREKLEPFVSEIESKGVKVICGENYLDGITEDYIFRSPGIRYDKPQLSEAVANGSVLTSEMELFFELCPAKLIAVTGSSGKTTTTTLISLMLKAQYGDEHVYVGGNIGKPLLPEVEKMTADDFAVAELSSFQLHTMKKSPDIAVVTNISPNHLDYHKDMDEYIDAKRNIYRHQKYGSRLVLNYGNPYTKAMSDDANDGVEVLFFNDNSEPPLSKSEILIPGQHNVQNYAAAVTALRGYVDMSLIRDIAKTFNGVEHRNEFVRELRGVRYYNSSIDSSPDRTTAALYSYDRKVIVICGGYDKHIPFEPLVEPLCERAKTVILTGATAEKIKAALISSGRKLPEIIEESDFTQAVLKASKTAEAGDIVLLSPACASFDAFPNFEVRGNTFKKIVSDLL